jgi:hypothetical protein
MDVADACAAPSRYAVASRYAGRLGLAVRTRRRRGPALASEPGSTPQAGIGFEPASVSPAKRRYQDL